MKASNGERVSVEKNVDQQDAAVDDIIVEDNTNEDIVDEFGAQNDEIIDKQVEYEDNEHITSNEEACLVIEKAAAVALKNASAAAAAAIQQVTANLQSQIDAEVAAYAYRETEEYKEIAVQKLAAENKAAVLAAVLY